MTVKMEASAPWPDGTLSRAWFDETGQYRYMLERDFRSPTCAREGCGRSVSRPTLFTEGVHCCKRCEMGMGHGGDCTIYSTGAVVFLMLNPSTADAMQNDPTVARCCTFTKRWGYRRLLVVNLFALRSTDPRALSTADDPVGSENDNFIMRAAREGTRGMVVAAWGANVTAHLGRTSAVISLLEREKIDLYALARTKEGHPKHPLYVKGDAQPIPFITYGGQS